MIDRRADRSLVATVDPAAPTTGMLHVDPEQLMRMLRELGRYGEAPDGGVSRPAFGPADNAARAYLIQASRSAGLAPRIDEAGTVIVRRRRARPGARVLLMGSHLDSVIGGGRLDGAYGTVAAIEVLRVLAQHGLPHRYEPVAVAFANEAGARFPHPHFGSLALTGQLHLPEQTVDRDGRSLRGPLRAAGGNLDRVHRAAWPPGRIGGFLELHVEQGPVLEHAGVPIGVVSAIIGRVVIDIWVKGRQCHAGTTPMELRRDALAIAARVVLAVEAVARDRLLCRVATVGVLNPEPNLDYLVAGEVGMTAELRDGDQQRLAAAERALLADVAEIARATYATIEVGVRARVEPVTTDPELRAAIAAAATGLGYPYLELPSGAGHDAQIMASLAPVGMIFVPSRDGVSHSPAEDTDPEHLVAGADILLRTAAQL
jgi:N-carbamoyl-L-amino-acid hydrolase